VLVALATLVGFVVLRPTGESRPDTSVLGVQNQVYAARVERVVDRSCPGDAEAALSCRVASFTLLAGPDEGTTVELDLVSDSPRVTGLAVGDQVVLGRQPDAPEAVRYAFLDPDRRSMLVLLTLLFAAAVIVLGRLRGVSALLGLAATTVVLLTFIVPAILDGRPPLAVALVGAVAIAYLALYLSHGFTTMTTIALLGTLGGLACVAVLAVAFMALADITGFGSEEAFIVAALGGTIDLRGLALGGMIIGALGAIDDMTVTQASAVSELRAARPDISRRSLLRSSMRIGRDHVASTVNTLVLAYAGASMPLLILFVLSEQSLGIVANNETLATEIVRTLVGSIGLVASVPITTWLAVHLGNDTGPPSRRRPPVEASAAAEGDDEDEPARRDGLQLPERWRDGIF
jgi:uncharacterized membrane protein